MSAIERAIEQAGSQAKLADGIGVSQGRVSQWVKGAPIPVQHFLEIERLTGVTPHELLEDELEKLKGGNA